MCIDQSFEVVGDYNSENRMLKADREWALSRHLNSHPSITINDFSYRGDIDFKDLKQAICSAYKVRPFNCNLASALEGTDSVSIYANATTFGKFMLVFKMLHFVILGLLIVMCNICLIVYIRKRDAKRQSEKVNVHVNEAVSQYFAL